MPKSSHTLSDSIDRAELLAQAARCRRLAAQCPDQRTVDILTRLAVECEVMAGKVPVAVARVAA